MPDTDRLKQSMLGKPVSYADNYQPDLLFPISRAENRRLLGLAGQSITESPLPGKAEFHGFDRWTAYELSWLNEKGKPCTAILEIDIPCDSPNIVESKSLKLYLNSLNQSRFASQEKMLAAIGKDLESCVGSAIRLRLLRPDNAPVATMPDYELLDDLDVTIDEYQVNPELLSIEHASPVRAQKLVSHLLKSNCPVTGQPDWASIYIDCVGPVIDKASLLKYIVSYRQQADFHEHCVERIFMDLKQACRLTELSVCARYLRRGGLDINPLRSTLAECRMLPRTARQ